MSQLFQNNLVTRLLFHVSSSEVWEKPIEIMKLSYNINFQPLNSHWNQNIVNEKRLILRLLQAAIISDQHQRPSEKLVV